MKNMLRKFLVSTLTFSLILTSSGSAFAENPDPTITPTFNGINVKGFTNVTLKTYEEIKGILSSVFNLNTSSWPTGTSGFTEGKIITDTLGVLSKLYVKDLCVPKGGSNAGYFEDCSNSAGNLGKVLGITDAGGGVQKLAWVDAGEEGANGSIWEYVQVGETTTDRIIRTNENADFAGINTVLPLAPLHVKALSAVGAITNILQDNNNFLADHPGYAAAAAAFLNETINELLNPTDGVTVARLDAGAGPLSDNGAALIFANDLMNHAKIRSSRDRLFSGDWFKGKLAFDLKDNNANLSDGFWRKNVLTLNGAGQVGINSEGDSEGFALNVTSSDQPFFSQYLSNFMELLTGDRALPAAKFEAGDNNLGFGPAIVLSGNNKDHAKIRTFFGNKGTLQGNKDDFNRLSVDLKNPVNNTWNNRVLTIDSTGKVNVKEFLSSKVSFALLGASLIDTSLISVNTVGANKVGINTVATLTKNLLAKNTIAKNDIALNFVGGNVFALGPVVSLGHIRGLKIGRFENTLKSFDSIGKNGGVATASCNQNPIINDFVVTGCHLKKGAASRLDYWVSDNGKSCTVQNNTTFDANTVEVQVRCFSPSGLPSTASGQSDPITPVGVIPGIPFYDDDDDGTVDNDDPLNAVAELYGDDLTLNTAFDASRIERFEDVILWQGEEPSSNLPDLPAEITNSFNSLFDATSVNPITIGDNLEESFGGVKFGF